MTAPDLNATCPHGKRAGITVCLHCRHEARMAARQRRNRMLARGGGIALAGGVCVAIAVGALVAVSPRARTTESAAPAAPAAPVAPVALAAAAGTPVGSPTGSPTGSPAESPAATTTTTTTTLAPAPVSVAVKQALPVPPPAPRTQSDAPVKQVMADGRIALSDSVFAERAGSEITVFFDNAIWRTRFEEKFERLIRSTLPAVVGEDARAALDSVPLGQLVRGGDLMRDLPTRGIPLAVPGQGRTLVVYPITRPGDGGPLVVAYRVTLPQ